MAPILFAHTLTLDGKAYDANRQPDPQMFGRVKTPTLSYAPKVASEMVDTGGGVALDPINITTYHRGAGASRRVLDGMFSYSKRAWTCDPGILMPGPQVTTVAFPNVPTSAPNRAFWEQDGHIFVAAGRYVHRIPNGSGAPVLEQDLGVGAVAANVRRISGSAVVSVGAAANIWQRPDGGPMNQTVPSGPGVKRTQLGSVFWTTGGVTAERLVGAGGNDVGDTTTTLRYTTGADPRVGGNWTPGVGIASIDAGPYPIASFATTRDHLYPVTTGGIRDIDSTGLAPLLTPEAESMLMSSNGVASIAAGGWVYANYGYGLLRVNVANSTTYAVTQWVTPMDGLPNETPVAGVGTAIMRRGKWIIYCQWDAVTNTSWVCWGREANQDEPGPMTWHVAPVVIDNWKVQAMWISGLVASNPRLWMLGSDVNGNVSLNWAHLALATPYQDIRQGRPYRCTISFSLWTQQEDAGDDSIPKDLEELAAEGENIGTGTNLTYSVSPNRAQTFYRLGTFTSGPRQILSATTTSIQGNVLQLQIDGNGLPAAPPVSRKTSLRVNPQADMRRIKSYQLRIGRTVTHGGGAMEGVDPRDKIGHLESLQASGARVTFTDEDGQNSTVKLRSGSLSFSEIEDNENDRVLIATLQLIVISTASTGTSMVLDTVGQGALDNSAWRLD